MLNLQLGSAITVDTESIDPLSADFDQEGEFISMEDVPMAPMESDADGQNPRPNPNNRIFGFLVKGADNRNPKFNEVHIHLSHPSIDMENLYKTRSMMVEGAVLHVWFEMIMTSFDSAAISAFMEECECRVVSHIVQIYSLSTLAAALMADEIHSGPSSTLLLSKQAEAMCGGVGQSLLDKTNSVEFMMRELKRYGSICVNHGMLKPNELEDFLSNDRLLFMPPDDLSKRLESFVSRRPPRSETEQ